MIPTTEVTERLTAPSLLDELPDGMGSVCLAASEPLEIAAALEARGISSRVASDRFGERDVFGLAERLFTEVRTGPQPPRTGQSKQRAGGPMELLRGAMFAAPGVIFVAAIDALHLQLPSWTYLLALTLGWAFGQAVAAIGSALASRNVALGSFALAWLVLAAALTASLAFAFDELRHGGLASVGMATAVTLYIVSCSILLLDGHMRAMALPLAPAIVVALLYLVHRPVLLPTDVTVGVIVSAIGVTVAMALRGVPGRFWSLPHLERRDLATGARYFGHGLLCGLATSVIIVLSSNSTGRTSTIPVAGYPVLISLGVMEWQLYSFRSRAQIALRRSTSVSQFGNSVSRAFLTSFSIYLATLASACVGVVAYLNWRHDSVPMTLLAAELCLGCVFYVGLVSSTCNGMNAVLVSGVVGLTIYGALFSYRKWTSGSFHHGIARTSCLIAIATALAVLIIGSRKTIRSAFSYQ